MALGDACADLGGEVLVFGSPGQRNLDAETSREQGHERAAEVFRACMPRFAARGVTLCVEPLTPRETNFLTTCAEATELIERVDHPHCVLHQDVKAMLSEAGSIPALIHRYAGKTGHFHANDSNMLGPGMGDTDFGPILDALEETHYERWVSVEVFDYTPGCERIARESLATLKRGKHLGK
jgi:sugar phosphate isomerase/epimerase